MQNALITPASYRARPLQLTVRRSVTVGSFENPPSNHTCFFDRPGAPNLDGDGPREEWSSMLIDGKPVPRAAELDRLTTIGELVRELDGDVQTAIRIGLEKAVDAIQSDWSDELGYGIEYTEKHADVGQVAQAG